MLLNDFFSAIAEKLYDKIIPTYRNLIQRLSE